MHPSPQATAGTELRIHAESLTPLRGMVSDGDQAVPFRGWLQLLALLEDRLGATAVLDGEAGRRLTR